MGVNIPNNILMSHFGETREIKNFWVETHVSSCIMRRPWAVPLRPQAKLPPSPLPDVRC